MGYIRVDYTEHLRRLRYIEQLEGDVERLRFFAWSLAVILVATIGAIAVVK